jgi:hypothetical protein
LEKKRRINNTPIVSANGFLIFNAGDKTFDIAQEEKLAHLDSAGHILRFHEEDCFISGEGKLDLGLELEQVELHSSGTIKHQRATNEIEINTMFGAEFMLDPASIITMADTIKASKAADATHNREENEKRLREWIAPKTAKEIANLIRPAAEMAELIPPQIQYTLLFTDIEFTWDTPTRTYVANCKANLGWIKDQAVAKQVEVKELNSRNHRGNSFEIYIEADPETWFFYSYNNGKMLILSSIEEFNKGIQTLDIDERKMKTGLGQDSYVFQLGSNNRLKRFMQYFEVPKEGEADEANILNEPEHDNNEAASEIIETQTP